VWRFGVFCPAWRFTATLTPDYARARLVGYNCRNGNRPLPSPPLPSANRPVVYLGINAFRRRPIRGESPHRSWRPAGNFRHRTSGAPGRISNRRAVGRPQNSGVDLKFIAIFFPGPSPPPRPLRKVPRCVAEHTNRGPLPRAGKTSIRCRPNGCGRNLSPRGRLSLRRKSGLTQPDAGPVRAFRWTSEWGLEMPERLSIRFSQEPTQCPKVVSPPPTSVFCPVSRHRGKAECKGLFNFPVEQRGKTFPYGVGPRAPLTSWAVVIPTGSHDRKIWVPRGAGPGLKMKETRPAPRMPGPPNPWDRRTRIVPRKTCPRDDAWNRAKLCNLPFSIPAWPLHPRRIVAACGSRGGRSSRLYIFPESGRVVS